LGAFSVKQTYYRVNCEADCKQAFRLVPSFSSEALFKSMPFTFEASSSSETFCRLLFSIDSS
jgi:hypothetical protein